MEEKTGFTPKFCKVEKWRSIRTLKRAAKTVFLSTVCPKLYIVQGSWVESKSTMKQNNQAYLKTTPMGILDRVKRYIMVSKFWKYKKTLGSFWWLFWWTTGSWWNIVGVTSRMKKILFLPPASEGWGRWCFHRCLSVHLGGGGGVTPVPGSFPGLWSQVLS